MRKKRFKIIYLELTNACNFTCDYCPIDQQTRKKENMPTDFACRILDEIAENDLTEFITFHLMGEPFLHHDLCKLTAYAEDRGLRVRLLTNGSLLERKRNLDLFNANLTRLEVGFRTPNDTAFDLRLRGGSLTLKEYTQRTKELIKDKLSSGARTELCIKLFIRSHAAALKVADAYEHLTSEDDNKRLARDFQQYTLEQARELGRSTEKWEKVRIVTKGGEYAIFDGINIGFSRIQDFWVREQRGENSTGSENNNGKYYNAILGGCSAGFRDNFGILSSGQVTTCCVDYDGKNVVADLKKNSLMEILESAEAKRIKRSLQRFVPPTPFCKECLGGPTIGSSLVKQVATIATDVLVRLSVRGKYEHIQKRQSHNDLD